MSDTPLAPQELSQNTTDSGSAFEGLEQSHVSLRGVIGLFLRDERHKCLGQGCHSRRGREPWPPPTASPLADAADPDPGPDRLPAGRRGPPSGRPAAPVRGGRGPSAECAGRSSSWVSGSSGPRGARVLKRLLLGAETAVLGARSREFLRAKGPAPAVSGDPAPPVRGRWGGRAILGARGWWPRLPGPRAPASPRGGGEVTTLGPPPRPPRPHEALPGTREDLGGRRLVGRSRHVDGPWRGPWKGVRRQAPHLRHRQPGAP